VFVRRMKSYTLFTMHQPEGNHEYQTKVLGHSQAQTESGLDTISGASPHQLQKHANC